MIRMVNDRGSGAERGWFRLKRDDGGVEKEEKRGIYLRGGEKRHKYDKILFTF